MASICIVTDNSAQFPDPSFRGQEFTKIVRLSPILHGKIHLKQEKQIPASLPPFAGEELQPSLAAPSVDEFRRLFSSLANQYNEIVGIFLSSSLNDCYKNAQEAILTLRGGPKIQIIDSQTTTAGLGLIVQKAAEIVFEHGSLADVERNVRSLMHRTYSLFCMPNLSYLYHNGFLDHAQATVGEMLGILPILAMEDGQLIPIEKKRNPRHVSVNFQEYIDEFDQLMHIALIQSLHPNLAETRAIREHVHAHFPRVPYSEHILPLPLATLFGPDATALTIVESNPED